MGWAAAPNIAALNEEKKKRQTHLFSSRKGMTRVRERKETHGRLQILRSIIVLSAVRRKEGKKRKEKKGGHGLTRVGKGNGKLLLSKLFSLYAKCHFSSLSFLPLELNLTFFTAKIYETYLALPGRRLDRGHWDVNKSYSTGHVDSLV